MVSQDDLNTDFTQVNAYLELAYLELLIDALYNCHGQTVNRVIIIVIFVIFGVDNNSAVHVDNKKDSLVLGEVLKQGQTKPR